MGPLRGAQQQRNPQDFPRTNVLGPVKCLANSRWGHSSSGPFGPGASSLREAPQRRTLVHRLWRASEQQSRRLSWPAQAGDPFSEFQMSGSTLCPGVPVVTTLLGCWTPAGSGEDSRPVTSDGGALGIWEVSGVSWHEGVGASARAGKQVRWCSCLRDFWHRGSP